MAGRKSTKTAAKAVEAAEVKSAEPKAEEIKAEEKAVMTKAVSAEQAAEPKAAVEKKAAEPKTASAKKTAEPKSAPAKKEAAVSKKSESVAVKAGKKEELKHNVIVQYAGKEYWQDELVKKAKDAWKKEDSKRKVGDLKSVDLYVKPEENKVYYVINGSDKGSFDI